MKMEKQFIDKLCPLLDRPCERQSCAAYTETKETWYSTPGTEETIILSDVNVSGKTKTVQYIIREFIIDKKTVTTRSFCGQYNKHDIEHQEEIVKIDVTQHGCKEEYEGCWLEVRNDNRNKTFLKADKRGLNWDNITSEMV